LVIGGLIKLGPTLLMPLLILFLPYFGALLMYIDGN